MTHASLFSGIGGFDLAAQWAGFENLFNCEIDPFCQRILNYHFPDAKQYSDIKSTDFTLWRGQIDILSGGFPCQPFSLAGKRKGTSDDRHLWPQMLRAIREIKPRWVVGENVLGIVSWDQGLVFEQVCLDLEAEGYEVQPYILPACGVDAPHQRYRVWFVAKNTERIRCDSSQPKEESEAGRFGQFGAGDNVRIRGEERVATDSTDARVEAMRERQDGICGFAAAPDPSCKQSERMQSEQRKISKPKQREFRRGDSADYQPNYWRNFPTQPPVRSRDDGFSERLDGITFPKWREQSIKAYGNAVVPQVVLQIFETIKEY